MLKQRIALFSLLFSTSLLGACSSGGSGGGGHSGGSSSNTPPTADPPASQDGVVLDTSNAQHAGSLTFFLSEFANATGEIAASAIILGQLDEDFWNHTISCPDDGSIFFQYEDNTPHGRLSTGDRLTIVYNDCAEQSGQLSLLIESASYGGEIFGDSLTDAFSGKLQLSLDLGFSDDSVTSVQRLEFWVDETSVNWRSTVSSLDIAIDGTSLSLRDTTVRKQIIESLLRYSVSLDGQVVTPGGDFSYQTDVPLSGALGQFPDEGMVTLTGRNSAVRFIGGDHPLWPELALYQIDRNGTGNFGNDTYVPWPELLVGTLFEITPDPGPGLPPILDLQSRSISLGDAARDMTVDEARERLYISLPLRNEIAVIDLATLTIVDRVFGGAGPFGLAQSSDGKTLYAALNHAGAVGAINLNSFAFEQIEIAAEANNFLTHEVVEVNPGVIFATMNGGLSNVVRIDRQSDDVVTPTARESLIRWQPDMVASPDGRWVYIGDYDHGTYPLYKLDAADPLAPIILETGNIRASAPDVRMALSPDGTRLYLRTGHILSTDSLSEVGQVGAGIPVALPSGTQLMVATDDGALELYDTESFALLDRWTTDCGFESRPTRFSALPAHGQWAFLGEDRLCVVDIFNPQDPPGAPGPSMPPAEPLRLSANTQYAVLPGIGFDLKHDVLRGQLYVSVPSTDDIFVFADADLAEKAQYDVPERPHGLDLSPNAAELAIALKGTGHIGFLDPDTGQFQTVDVSSELGSTDVHDVAYAGIESLFATADTQWSGFAYVVHLSRSSPQDVARVADERLIYVAPELVPSPSLNALYVGEPAIPNSVYKLDIGTPAAPITSFIRNYEIEGADRFAVSPDGQQLALRSGQVLRTHDLSPIGRVREGVSAYSADSAVLYVAGGSGELHAYDAATFQRQQIIESDCPISIGSRLLTLPGQDRWAVLGNDLLCLISVAQAPSEHSKAARPWVYQTYRCSTDCLIRRHVAPKLRNDPMLHLPAPLESP